MSGYRKHGRTLVNYSVKLTHDQWGEIEAQTRDISESGVFVCCASLPKTVSVGDAFHAKLWEDNPQSSVLTVVRLAADGVGLEYA